jgi:hypothetical protein
MPLDCMNKIFGEADAVEAGENEDEAEKTKAMSYSH